MENKLLLDENLSRRLLPYLLPIFPLSSHVAENALTNTADLSIWEFALNNGYAILTKDLDFNYLSTLYGCPPKVIRLDCGIPDHYLRWDASYQQNNANSGIPETA